MFKCLSFMLPIVMLAIFAKCAIAYNQLLVPKCPPHSHFGKGGCHPSLVNCGNLRQLLKGNFPFALPHKPFPKLGCFCDDGYIYKSPNKLEGCVPLTQCICGKNQNFGPKRNIACETSCDELRRGGPKLPKICPLNIVTRCGCNANFVYEHPNGVGKCVPKKSCQKKIYQYY